MSDESNENDILSNPQKQKENARHKYDVFLCYNKEDMHTVKKIGNQLKKRGIVPWLDDWEVRPGMPWQREIEQQIEYIKSAAVFVGQRGIGPWQLMETDALLREFVDRQCPVIPVHLSN